MLRGSDVLDWGRKSLGLRYRTGNTGILGVHVHVNAGIQVTSTAIQVTQVINIDVLTALIDLLILGEVIRRSC